MPQEAIELLKSINQNLEDIKKKENLPKLIYAKEIAEKYHVNVNKATAFCKKYGLNFRRMVYRNRQIQRNTANKRN